MKIPFRGLIFAFALLTILLTSYTVFAQDALFDRLDGTGPSHKKVDVIEWDGNLEVHVYPKGSLKGLSVKLDDRIEGQMVMVIGYRFDGMKTPLVRRAILGTPFNKNVKAFVDPTNKEFDKLAISNDTLTQPYVPYKLDTPPKQWYPDGDPRNDSDAPASPNIKQSNSGPVPSDRIPSSATNQPDQSRKSVAPKKNQRDQSDDSDGAIPDFSW